VFTTIYMFPDIPMMRAYADRLHGLDASPRHLGLCVRKRSVDLAFQPKTGIGTLLHQVWLAVRTAFSPGSLAAFDFAQAGGERVHL
jgi:hypothetical protein